MSAPSRKATLADFVDLAPAAAPAKKLRPSDVDTHKARANRYASEIKTLWQVAHFRDVPFPFSTEELAAVCFVNYAAVVQPILTQTLADFDDRGGALNRQSARRRKSTGAVAKKLGPREISELHKLRDDLQQHLHETFHSLCQAPPLAGGDTARWSIGATMWMLVCLLNCVLNRFGLGADRLATFRPCTRAYLAAQLLVLDKKPVKEFSVRAMQLTMHNLLERLQSLDWYDPALDEMVAALSLRCAELICGSGTATSGYDAVEWCAPVASAHHSQRASSESGPPAPAPAAPAAHSTAAPSGLAPAAAGATQVLACTTDFVTHSMTWFATVNAYLAAYRQLAPPPSPGPLPSPTALRYSIVQTRQMRWFPPHALLYRVLEFFCEYAHGCVDDSYRIGLAAYCKQFEPTPGDASIYRIYQNTTASPPAAVLAYPLPNVSHVGREYVKLIRYGLPLKDWLHRAWNWRFGETRVRSDYLGSTRFKTQLAVLYIVNLFFANRTRVSFRHRVVLYHGDPAFAFLCQRGKRSGYPFIVEQFGGWWSVGVPHRVDPRSGTFPLDTSPAALADAAREFETRRTVFADAMDEDEPAATPAGASATPVGVSATASGGVAVVTDADTDGSDMLAEGAAVVVEDAADDAGSHERPERSRPLDDAAASSDDDTGRSDALFEAEADAGADDYIWDREREAAQQADERGDDVAVGHERTRNARLPTDMPDDAFFRVYDCESFIEAWTVWAIALLHVKGGIIDGVDLSRFLCALFGWPHPGSRETSADLDAVLEVAEPRSGAR